MAKSPIQRFGVRTRCVSKIRLVSGVFAAILIFLVAMLKRSDHAFSESTSLWLVCGVIVAGCGVCLTFASRRRDKFFYLAIPAWLAKASITLLVSLLFWNEPLPPVETTKPTDGDFFRYVQGASGLINGNLPSSVGFSYPGIVVFFSYVFRLAGSSPINLALLGSLASTVAALIVIDTIRATAGRISRGQGLLLVAILIPEVWWFDAQPSKDSFVSLALAVFLVPLGLMVATGKRLAKRCVYILIGAGLLLFLRPQLLWVGVLLGLVMLTLTPSRRRLLAVVVALAATLAIIALGPTAQQLTSGVQAASPWQAPAQALSLRQNYSPLGNSETLDTDISTLVPSSSEHKPLSPGVLLRNEGTPRDLITLPARMVAYLFIPLPLRDLDWGNLYKSVPMTVPHNDWTLLLAGLSAVIYVGLLPLIVYGVRLAVSARRTNASLSVIPIATILLLTATALGTVYMHERYRVSISPWLICSAWFGLLSVKRLAAVTFGLMSLLVLCVLYLLALAA